MGFYQQWVRIVKPTRIQADYGSATRLSYDLELGATLSDPVAVDLQPTVRTEVDSEIGRTQVTSGYRMHTPPGVDLDLDPTDRVVHREKTFEVVGEVERWLSMDYPSGVDHLEVSLEEKRG